MNNLKKHIVFAIIMLLSVGCIDDANNSGNTPADDTTIEDNSSDDTIVGKRPELKELVIEGSTYNSITLARPEFVDEGDPDPIIFAYIGEEGEIDIAGATVSNYTEGTIDVSDSGYTFTGIDNGKNYRIIVTAENSYGYSVRQILCPIADQNALDEAYEYYLNINHADFLTGGDISINKVTNSLSFPTSGINGTTLIWESLDESVITDDGIITRYLNNAPATMTLRIKKGSLYSQPITYSFTVYRILFYESFDDDYSDWYYSTSIYDDYSFTISDQEFISNRSVRMTSNDDASYELTYTFPNKVNPEYIGFYMRVTELTTEMNYLWFLDSTYSNTQYQNVSGISLYYSTTFQQNVINLWGQGVVGNYSPNVWYHFEFKRINWIDYNFELYINGSYYGVYQFDNFRTSMNKIYMKVGEYTSVYFDEILIW